MKISASELYTRLTKDYNIIGQKGVINFTLKDLTISINSKDSVGNLLQEWLIQWMRTQYISFEENPSSQTFPDIYLDLDNKRKGLLEVKSFDWNRGAGFDLANFDSYCQSLLTDSFRLDSDYLVIGYKMEGSEITIANVWLKKIWELSGGSGTFPLKVQEKKSVIYNIRPITWYSTGAKFKPFKSKEEFLSALNETRYQYPKTHHDNSHWLSKVLKNYEEHTGVLLKIKQV